MGRVIIGDRGARLRNVTFAVVVAFLSICLPVQNATTAEIARFQPPAPPQISAKAVYVTDLTTGTELFALDADVPLPPASLTKIVSALVILEHANLEEKVEIIEQDLVPKEQSQVGLVAGDRLTVRDLLYGLLIPSGNDAALALARHVGNSAAGAQLPVEEAVAKFVAMMNEKAATLGATSAHFANPTGMDAPGHVMSARDIARVTKVGLENRLFAEIVSKPSAVLASEVLPDGYSVTTTNMLLAEGLVNGVKTGSTPNAGGCLVTSFPVGPNDVLAVVLGSDVTETTDGASDSTARFADTRALLNAVTSEYQWLDPTSPGAIAGLLEELQVWDVSAGSEALLPVPTSRVSEIRYRLVLGPPTSPGEPAGKIQFFVGNQLLSARTAVQAGS